MTAVVAIVVLLLVVGLALLVAWPLVAPGRGAAAAAAVDVPAEAGDEVEDELVRSLQAIREIAFDRASGHLSDDDFRALDADERARAVELMRRRDALRAELRSAAAQADGREAATAADDGVSEDAPSR